MASYYTDGQGGLSTILRLFGVGKLRPDDPETGNLYKEGFGDRITGGRAEALNLQHQMAARDRQNALAQAANMREQELQYLPRELDIRTGDALKRYGGTLDIDMQNLPNELGMRTSDALSRYGGQLQMQSNAEQERMDKEDERRMARAFKGAQEFGYPNPFATDAAAAAQGQVDLANQQRALEDFRRREALQSDDQRNDIAMQQLQIEEAGRRQALAQALAPVIQNIGSGGSIISDPYKGLTTVSPSGMEEYIPQSIDATTGRVVQSPMAEPLRRIVGPRFGGRMEDSSQGPRAIIPPGMTPGATNAPTPTPSTGAPAPTLAPALDNNTLRALLQRIQQLQEQRQLERLPFTAF